MPTSSSNYQTGLDALDQQDYAAARGSLIAAAGAGDARAQYRLGLMYANSEGVKLNYVKAARWITQAAEQGLVVAQSLLAWLHAGGYGVRQDDRMAGHWYRAAARAGDPKAQYTLAAMYRWGRYGATPNRTQMVLWYLQSARRGFAPAQYALGQLLNKGELIERDEIAAYQWLSQAIVNGSSPARRALELLSQGMTPERIESARRQMLGEQFPDITRSIGPGHDETPDSDPARQH